MKTGLLTKFSFVAYCLLLIFGCFFAYPENHVENWLVILFLSRQKFHAKQMLVLSRSMKLAPDVSVQQSVGLSPGRDIGVLKSQTLNHYECVIRMGR